MRAPAHRDVDVSGVFDGGDEGNNTTHRDRADVLHFTAPLYELSHLEGEPRLANVPDEDKTVLVAAGDGEAVAVPCEGCNATLVAGDLRRLVLHFRRVVHARVVMPERALLVADREEGGVEDHRARALHSPLERRPLRHQIPKLHVAIRGRKHGRVRVLFARTLDKSEVAHRVGDLAQLLRDALGVSHALVVDTVPSTEDKGVRVRPADRRPRGGVSGGRHGIVDVVHRLEDVERGVFLERGDLGAGPHRIPFPADVTDGSAPDKRVKSIIVYGRCTRRQWCRVQEGRGGTQSWPTGTLIEAPCELLGE